MDNVNVVHSDHIQSFGCPLIDLQVFFCPLCNSYVNCEHVVSSVTAQHRAKEIEQAVQTIGYFMIQGLPVVDVGEKSVVEGTANSTHELRCQVRRICKSFFQQPIQTKMMATSKDRAKRGFSPIATENFASLVGHSWKPNDTVEKYRIGPTIVQDGDCAVCDGGADTTGIYDETRDPLLDDRISNDLYYNCPVARAHFYPNDWSQVSVPFREVSQTYFDSLYSLSLILLSILEFSCNLLPGCLSTEVDKHTSILSYNYCPPISCCGHSNADGSNVNKTTIPVNERIAEHTDVSMFTIVTELGSEEEEQDIQLEIFDSNCQLWKPVRYQPSVYLVNIGDCLSERSRGRLKSALHRVVMKTASNISNSTDDGSSSLTLSKERYSSAFFFAPNYSAPMNWIEKSGQETTDVVDYDTWRKLRVKRAMELLRADKQRVVKSNNKKKPQQPSLL
jgi:isopenicillin N synthase-like dioxygenase